MESFTITQKFSLAIFYIKTVPHQHRTYNDSSFPKPVYTCISLSNPRANKQIERLDNQPLSARERLDATILPKIAKKIK